MKTTILLAAVSLLAMTAFAGPLSLANPGFELFGSTVWQPPCPPAAPGCYSLGNVNGGVDWQASTGLTPTGGPGAPRQGQMYLNPGVQFGSQFGSLAAFISGPASGSGGYKQTIWQTIAGSSAVPGETYELTVQIGNRSGALDPPTGSYFVGLYYGAGTPINVVYPNISIPDGGWALFTLIGVAPAGASGPLTVGFGVDANAAPGTQVWFDDAGMVPEPATFALGGLGLLAIGILTRRRRR